MMPKKKSVLICGTGEIASAAARRLYAEGHTVALHAAAPPRLLRRRMTFSDAWFDGYAPLEGIEARRAQTSSEFVLGLQTRDFIPLLRQSFSQVVPYWPWDVIVAVREEDEATRVALRGLAQITIGLGEGFEPGIDCDVVVATEGCDPGAIRHERGAARPERAIRRCGVAAEHCDVLAPCPGLFRASVSIGMTVRAGQRLGFVGGAPVLSPVAGRIKGSVRKEQPVDEGDQIVEIALSPSARVTGISERNRLISRGVAFAIAMRSENWTPFPNENRL